MVTDRRGLTIRGLLVPLALALLFLVSRMAILLTLRIDDVAFVANDVGYYGFYLDKLAQGEPGVMPEYPVPAVWLLRVLFWLGGGQDTWAATFVAVFLAIDALVATLFYRRGNASGTLFWILFTGAQGAIVLHRFDLIPAALVAVACLYALRHPVVAGAAIGLGAAVKLWPALLIGPMLAPGPVRDGGARRRLSGFVVVGFGLAAASLLSSGWARSASAVLWQSQRGLHIESVPATPLTVLRTYTHATSWHIELTQFNALEFVSGPGISGLLTASSVMMGFSVLLTLLLSTRLVRNVSADDPRLHEAMALAILAIILVTVVANKTLSPQYIVWLGGPVSTLLITRQSNWLRRHTLVLATALLLVAGLTQLSYPWMARAIMALPQGSGPETAVLVLRNVGLVCLAGYAVWLALAASRRTTV